MKGVINVLVKDAETGEPVRNQLVRIMKTNSIFGEAIDEKYTDDQGHAVFIKYYGPYVVMTLKKGNFKRHSVPLVLQHPVAN